VVRGRERDTDVFTEAYTSAVTREPPPTGLAEMAVTEVAARLRPQEPVALKGTVLTRDGARNGYVVVGADSLIAGVSTRKPRDVPVHDTHGGVICPGLIDLHGHPDFNVFAAWEPPRRYINRYQWRQREPLYQTLIKDPANRLRRALPAQTLLRYAEIRALVGGVTAIQGTTKEKDLEEESLIRNVDRWIFGDQVGSSMIDLPSKTGRGREELDQILADIAAGTVKAFYLHLAEGTLRTRARLVSSGVWSNLAR
jgi:5-methylthioadenosine/S-adenosylhomocysteine deaminase